MSYQDFLFKIIEIQHKLIGYFKIIYSTLSENFIFKTIISMVIFSIIMWVLFWCFKLLLMIIDYRFYKETADKSDATIMLNRWDAYKSIKATPKEQNDMREMLEEFYHDSEQAFNDTSDNIDF